MSLPYQPACPQNHVDVQLHKNSETEQWFHDTRRILPDPRRKPKRKPQSPFDMYITLHIRTTASVHSKMACDSFKKNGNVNQAYIASCEDVVPM